MDQRDIDALGEALQRRAKRRTDKRACPDCDKPLGDIHTCSPQAAGATPSGFDEFDKVVAEAEQTPEYWKQRHGLVAAELAALREQVEQLQRELAEAEERNSELVHNQRIQDSITAAVQERAEKAEQREQAAREDSERMDWLEDATKCYWVTVQIHPSAQHIYSGQGPALREAIDSERQK